MEDQEIHALLNSNDGTPVNGYHGFIHCRDIRLDGEVFFKAVHDRIRHLVQGVKQGVAPVRAPARAFGLGCFQVAATLHVQELDGRLYHC